MGTEETQHTEGGGVPERHRSRVLYVDGDQQVRESVATYADREMSNLVVTTVADERSALAELQHSTPDCLVTEYDLPDSDGPSLCQESREAGYTGPIVLFTDRSPAEVARTAFAAGAADFVQKQPGGGYAFLFDKIRGAIDGEQTIDWADGRRRTVETLVTLLDETNDELWSAGSLDVLPPSPEHVYDAVADVLESDSQFRASVADTTGADVREPQLWALDDMEGALEHQRIELPTLTAAASRLDIFRDATDEIERRQRLDRFERLLDTASDGLYTLDSNGHYTFVNESMAETLGYDREEMLGMHAGTVLTEAEYERGQRQVTDIVADAERESKILEMTVERADGTELPVAISFSPLYDDTGGYDGLVGVLRDITERRERERKLHESERRYRTLAENIPDGGVGMFDADLNYILVEGELFGNLDYETEDFTGTPLAEIHTDGFMSEFSPQYRAVFDGERATIEFTHGDRHYRTNLVPIRDDDGDIDAGLALTLDVTEQREYERELERQNERLNEFASIVSHDLRNPLNVIEGRLELYREQGEETHLDSIEASVESMKYLIDDLLELARSGQTLGETEAVDIGRVATTSWDTVETDGAALTVEDSLTIVADVGRLQQVFANLFRNSVEHGSTDSRTKSDDSVEHGGTGLSVRIGTLPDGAGFFVEDSGTGISEDRRRDVLNYGVTGGDDGTGIGLAIVSEVAKAHGWDVNVTESDEGGARFEFHGVEIPD